MMTGCTSCEACRSIGDDITVNVGRDHHFPEPVYQLERFEMDNAEDLRRCRGCGALFHWIDHPHNYGSGNEWDEQLVRLKPRQLVAARAFLERAEAPAPLDEVTEALGWDLMLMMVSWAARRHPEWLTPMIPSVVTLLERRNDGNVSGILYSWVGKDRGRTQALLDIFYARGDALGKNCHYLRGRIEIQLAELKSKRT